MQKIHSFFLPQPPCSLQTEFCRHPGADYPIQWAIFCLPGDPQQNDTSVPSKNTEGQSKPANSSSLSKHCATTVVGSQQPSKLLLQNSQIQLVARGTDQTTEPKMAPLIEKQASSTVQEKVELKRQGTGISVIQHTNSLSRNSSFEKSESFERV